MYTFSPKHKNLVAAALSVSLSVVFVIAWLLPLDKIEPLEPFLLSIRIGGLLALSAAVYVAFRYLCIKYVYELEPDPQDADGLLLTITEIRGRRRITVCRIGTADIERFEKLKRRAKRQKSNRPRGMKTYDYCVDMHPDAYFIVLKDDAECRESERGEVIFFMPDEKMTALIAARV